MKQVIQFQEKTIQHMVQKSVREAVASEFMKLRASLIMYASEREQHDIEARYKRPARKNVKTFSLAV